MPDLKDKIAIVMGASTPGGLGEATARRLAKEGATVVLSGLGAEHLNTLAGQLGGSTFEADITERDQVRALVDHAISTYGKLDIGVNLAGFSHRMPIAEMTEEHLLKMTKVNYFGSVWFVQQVAERIVEDGAIVCTSSLSAHDHVSGLAGYATAKRAADRFIQAAAVEYRAKRLRINSIIPSTVDTAILRQAISEYDLDFDDFAKAVIDMTPLGRLSRPEDIAAMIFMMVRDEFFETGLNMHCGGGISLLGNPRSLA